MNLPRPEGGMKIDQALMLELYRILVDHEVMSEQEAVERYEKHRDKEGWK